MKRRKPRHREGAFTELPIPTQKEKEEWKSNRRARFDQFRRAWVSHQPHARVVRTVWQFKTNRGIDLTVDVTSTIQRMVDFICTVTGIKRLMTPPSYTEDIPLRDLIPEGLSVDERAVFEATSYLATPHIYIEAGLEYPKVVIECVIEKFHTELTLFFGHPSIYEEQFYGNIEDDELYFSPPPRFDLTFAKYPALKKWVETTRRQECQIPYLAYCQPSFETAGGLLGRAERCCLVKVLEALDGITPGTGDWWSVLKQGPRVYYRHASALRFALYEALLWLNDKGASLEEVTALDTAHYLKYFEQRVGAEHALYNKLRACGLPRWKELKAELIELIICNEDFNP